MKVLHDPHEAYAQLSYQRAAGNVVGLVPTMGALHAGHLSLVTASKNHCDLTVATIFVNPTQFGPSEDLARYPRTLDSDLQLLKDAGCDYVFVPSAEKVYRLGHSTFIEPPAVSRRWEGEIRPTHFRGVTTVVLKLFNMIPAQFSYFGSKDFQQVATISTMVEDLNIPIRVEACETVREPDGLAMSSRNRYLSAEERQRSLGLFRSLKRAQALVAQGERNILAIESAMMDELLSAPVDSVDYARIVDTKTMEPLETLADEAVAILAARIGTTRLIDNAVLSVRG